MSETTTPKKGLYQWAPTDEKLSTFQGLNDAFEILDNAILDTAPTWVNLTLQNGTTVFSNRIPRYTKVGHKVTVEGDIVATATGIVIGTLPAGFRPPVTRIFKLALNWSTSNDGLTMYVNPDGTINLQTTANIGQSISLNGISFYVD